MAARSLPWGRLVKFGAGAALLGIGALTTYQQIIVRVSREAVVNARVVSIRAPIDGSISAGAGVDTARASMDASKIAKKMGLFID
jgi:hypothetical protein